MDTAGTPSTNVHPVTGEALDHTEVSQHPQVVRALFTVLAEVGERARKRAARPARFGLPWDAGEDGVLKQRFEEDASVEALARELDRTPGAIRSRLVLLGLVEPDTALRLR